MQTKIALIVGIAYSAVSQAATLNVNPTYTVFGDDCVGQHQGGGVYTVPTNCEVYEQELWERPYEADKWVDSNGTRTTTGKYWGYNDISNIKAGWNDDYLFLSTSVVGTFEQDGNSIDNGVGYKGRYVWYFGTDPNGTGGFLIEVAGGDADAVGNIYDNSKGKIYWDSDMDAGGSGLTTTGEYISSSGNAYATELNPNSVYVRQSPVDPFSVEVLVRFDRVNGLDSDYIDETQFARFGVATSNPSGVQDIFANDSFQEGRGVSVEYDTAMFEGGAFVVPEPSSTILVGLSALGLLIRKRK